MNKNFFHELHARYANRLWINNPTMAEAKLAVEAGAIACTSNPTYAARLLREEPDVVRPLVREAAQRFSDDRRAVDWIQLRLIERIIPVFLPLQSAKPGWQGFCSIQADPLLDEDADAIIADTQQHRKLGAGYIAKIPATAAGLKAIEFALRENIPVIVTEIFAVSQALSTCRLYQRVCAETGRRPACYVTHITGIYDECLQKIATERGIDVAPAVLAKAGALVGRKQYALCQRVNAGVVLLGGGVRQPHHFTDFFGGEMHVTLNWSTVLEMFEQNPPLHARIDEPADRAAVEELRAKLPEFRAAWDDDGLKEPEFAHFAPVLYFRDMFLKGWEAVGAAVKAERSQK